MICVSLLNNDMMCYLYCQNPMHCSAVVAVIYLLRRFNHMTLKKSVRQTGNVMSILSNQQIVNEYFKLISKNDVWGLLKLFSDDAVVYEPFSNIHGGLQNKIAIENILKVSIMANEGLEKTIRFEDNKEDTITAIVIFEREGRIKGKFVFHFVIESIPSYSGRKKIKSLRIRFLD